MEQNQKKDTPSHPSAKHKPERLQEDLNQAGLSDDESLELEMAGHAPDLAAVNLSLEQGEYLKTARRNNPENKQGKTGTWSLLKALYDERPGKRVRTSKLERKAEKYHGKPLAAKRLPLLDGRSTRASVRRS
jgi:hypothetical protein